MKKCLCSLLLLLPMISAQTAQAVTVRVTIENLAPTDGVYLTPVWVGFHNGSFDSYNPGQAASSALERIAEDGNTGPISNLFASAGRVQGTIGGLIAPGDTVDQVFRINPNDANRYFSYASMVLPSSDYFVANGNPEAHDLLNILASGPISFDIGLPGSVNDAGTEINDFATSAGNPLFGLAGGQGGPDQGVAEGGVVTSVVDNPPFTNFLNQPANFATDFSNLNFNDTALYPNGIARITISFVPVPEPITGALGLMSLGALGLASRRRLLA